MSKSISFSLGKLVATPGALAALEKVGRTPLDYLQRHAKGDWGETLGEEDAQANADALVQGTRLLSSYLLPDETKLWIITEAITNPDTGERAATTLLLPEEY
jgi:hypothetical protein